MNLAASSFVQVKIIMLSTSWLQVKIPSNAYLVDLLMKVVV